MKIKLSTQIVNWSDEEISALRFFFINALQDIYSAEKNLIKVLPKMVQKSVLSDLRVTLENHLAETENQIVRLEQVFASIDEEPASKESETLEGLLREIEVITSASNKTSIPRDLGIIFAGQKIKHYEIASYGTLKTIAEVLGFTQASNLLNQTLQEEITTDSRLTQIATSQIEQSGMNTKS